MKYLTLFLLTAFLLPPTRSQDAGDVHSKIRVNLTERDYAAAVSELKSLSKREPRVFAANNYDYLLARLCERTGDIDCAGRMYHSVAARSSVLREYALWHLSALARSSGNLLAERMQLMELAAFSPESLLSGTARNRLAQSWFDSRNYDLAIAALMRPMQTVRTKPPNDKSRERENKLLLGRAHLYNGETELARGIFNELIANLSNPAQPDDFAVEAAKGLDLIEAGAGKFGGSVPTLSDYEHLRRAQIYQFNRDFTAARLHFAAIINNHPSSGIVPDAIYQIGRGYTQSGDFTEAVKWHERVQEQFADHPVSKDALLQLASGYSRVGKAKEAVSRYQKYIERYPADERVDRAYLNIIDVLRDLGEETEAVKWAGTVQVTFRGKVAEAQALFAQTRIHLSRNDWQSALAEREKLNALKDLGGTTVPGGTSAGEITFLRAFVLEQLRRFPEAIDTYLSIPDGRNEYYGWRSTERLRALAKDNAAKIHVNEKLISLTAGTAAKEPDIHRLNLQAAIRLAIDEADRKGLLENLKKVYSILPAYKQVPQFKLIETGRREIRKIERSTAARFRHQAIADELVFLGLFDEAAPEIEAAKRTSKNTVPTELHYTIAYYYLKGERADLASAFIEPLFKAPADYQAELIPTQIGEMLYPAVYFEALLKHAKPREVDPRFLLAIMRQESRFRANVKSYAAARGLMQFISTTSEKIAGELGRENFNQDALYDPPTAILFGSQYVGDLFKLFPKQPDAVAASYNGGEDNMKRWYGRAKSDLPDRYVPEIGFSQSKDYVYRVMSNYRVYQMLYDENLQPG